MVMQGILVATTTIMMCVVVALCGASAISLVHAFSYNPSDAGNTTNQTHKLEALYVPAGCNQPIRIPATVNQFSHGVEVANTFFCLNADGHYHLKGLLLNTLPESRDFGSITITLQDNSTGADLTSKSGMLGVSHVGPGRGVGFDVDTGYIANEEEQLRHMKAMITV